MELNARDLALILGIKPQHNLNDFTIIIKDKKSNNTLKELSFEELFEGLFNLPINLEKLKLN